jgi:rhamnosyltransferase
VELPMSELVDAPTKSSSSLRKIAAVVVLYSPEDDVYENILSYVEQVDLVFLVDNSDEPSSDLIEKFSTIRKVISIVNECNLGIAAALNIGARKALAHGCDLLLTMDQDSSASPGMVKALRDCFISQEDELLAIVSPFHLISIVDPPDPSLPPYEAIETVWTSGNLLRLSTFQKVGPFDEPLFIDFVDHEYCLRLKRNGYRVVQSNAAVLHHNIGTNLRKIDFATLSLVVSNHSPLRRYYITRNRFWVTKKYREFRRFSWIDKRRFWAELVTILLFEKYKLEKLKMIIRGYLDYRIGKMGKFVE